MEKDWAVECPQCRNDLSKVISGKVKRWFLDIVDNSVRQQNLFNPLEPR